jgi:hypothetical protein
VAFASRLTELVEGLAALAAVVRPLGRGVGTGLVAVGIVLLTVATRRRRPLAIVGGAAVGALAALAMRDALRVHLGGGQAIAAVAAAAAGAAAGGLAPVAFPFAAAALPGALLGWEVPLAGRPVLGAAAGGLIAGLAGLALGRALAATVASIAGGLLVTLGLLATAGAHPLAREIAVRPFALVAFTAVTAIAGAAFQLATSREDRGARSPESPSSASREGEP